MSCDEEPTITEEQRRILFRSLLRGERFYIRKADGSLELIDPDTVFPARLPDLPNIQELARQCEPLPPKPIAVTFTFSTDIADYQHPPTDTAKEPT